MLRKLCSTTFSLMLVIVFMMKGSPLFPDCHGRQVSAARMIDLILEIANYFNEPLVNKMGQSRFGKHSWRATGAVFLGEAGVEIQKIMMIGRWHCNVVLLYTRNAPISDIAGGLQESSA